MSIFQSVKESVTARQAAEQYGLKVNRNGMVCCPFHKDRHPSMKVEKGFYCFACGAKGDVITFTGKLFGMSPYEAAKKLITDFNLPIPLKEQKSVQNKSRDREGKKVQSRYHFSVKSSTDFLIIFSNLRKCWKGLLYQAFPAFCVSEDTPHIMAFRSLTWR